MSNKPLNISCLKCKKVFDRGETMSLYANNYYHNTCFCCNFCNVSLAGLGFFTKPDGSFQCKTCHEYHAPKCKVCEKSISDGVKYNIYKGEHYHKDCFRCVKCQGIILEGRSFVESPNGLVCMECAKAKTHVTQATMKSDDKFNHSSTSSQPHPSGREHICEKCKRHIPANVFYAIYEGKQFHNECFTCNRCGKNLSNTVCRRVGSAIVCKDCS